ncbi:hypothetical protein QR680_013852 [Steinernema hermaphroditum]|uniref:Uncharacterized protein n=1 Tax=Steinernema hermaphroditum TaxID=289476 RepID=A0AA39M282_9BILA|nr:hypothetical protein QR680_013852 [Steinernema hermaphroditum]
MSTSGNAGPSRRLRFALAVFTVAFATVTVFTVFNHAVLMTLWARKREECFLISLMLAVLLAAQFVVYGIACLVVIQMEKREAAVVVDLRQPKCKVYSVNYDDIELNIEEADSILMDQ